MEKHDNRRFDMENISKKQFEEMMKVSADFHTQKTFFDAKVQEIYGEHYSDFDYDYIIDSLDYGAGKLSYECFCELMQNIASGNGNDNNAYRDIIAKYDKNILNKTR